MQNPIVWIVLIIVLALVVGRCDMQHSITQTRQDSTERRP